LASSNRPPPPFAASQAKCESYGGTFTIVDSGGILWTCNGLPDIGTPGNSDRFVDLNSSCSADGGFLLWTNDPSFPQFLTCDTRT
jgi:hypothetical protein